MQYLPSFLGVGLLQSRRLNWRQSALHEDHDVHVDHLPSTEGQTCVKLATNCYRQREPWSSGYGRILMS